MIILYIFTVQLSSVWYKQKSTYCLIDFASVNKQLNLVLYKEQSPCKALLRPYYLLFLLKDKQLSFTKSGCLLLNRHDFILIHTCCCFILTAYQKSMFGGHPVWWWQQANVNIDTNHPLTLINNGMKKKVIKFEIWGLACVFWKPKPIYTVWENVFTT